MSNNKIDQFFSRKLETHSATPSADAWSRLESKLDKKEKKQDLFGGNSLRQSLLF